MQPEVGRIREQLKRVMFGEAWHGPALMELLSQFNSGSALKTVAPGRHTVWAVVLHIAFWLETASRRLNGEACLVNSPEDWPNPEGTSDANWDQAIRALISAYEDLDATLASMSEDDLDDLAPGGGRTTKYVLAHGAIEHIGYHVGQIALVEAGIS